MRIRLRYQCEFGVVVQHVQAVLLLRAIGEQGRFSPNCTRANEVPGACALHTSSKEVSVYVQAAYTAVVALLLLVVLTVVAMAYRNAVGKRGPVPAVEPKRQRRRQGGS